MREFHTLLMALFLSIVPMRPATAQVAAVPTDPLEVVVGSLVLTHPIVDWTIAMCDIPVRTKYERDPDYVDLERRLPGITDQMVAVTRAYCEREVPKAFAAYEDRVRADWRSMSPANLARLARLLRPALETVYSMKPDFRPGDTAGAAVARFPQSLPTESAAFKRAQIAFARTPGGAALIDRFAAYQIRFHPWMKNDSMRRLAIILPAALRAAEAAANDYARLKGAEAPFEQQPAAIPTPG